MGNFDANRVAAKNAKNREVGPRTKRQHGRTLTKVIDKTSMNCPQNTRKDTEKPWCTLVSWCLGGQKQAHELHEFSRISVGANRSVSVFARLLAGASGPPCFFLLFLAPAFPFLTFSPSYLRTFYLFPLFLASALPVFLHHSSFYLFLRSSSLSFHLSVCRRDACVRRVPVALLLILSNLCHSWACFDLRRIYDLIYPQKEIPHLYKGIPHLYKEMPHLYKEMPYL